MFFRAVLALVLITGISAAAAANPPASGAANTPAAANATGAADLTGVVAPAETAAENNPHKSKVKPVFVTAPPNPHPKCPPGSTVVVEVRGVPLLVPREAAYRLTLDDGKTHLTLGRPAKDYDCNTPVIKNVRGIATTEYKLGIPGGNNASEKSFGDTRAAMLRAPRLRGSIVQNLPGGVEKVIAPAIASELFQLPLDAAPTYDKVPVIFACDNAETGDLGKLVPHYCRAAYLHPSGLPITYSVLRADVANDDFLAVDKAKRKIIDGMVAGAKDKKDLENKDQ